MDIRVYDWQGNERDMAYLRAKYGEFAVHSAPQGDGPVYKVSALREKINAAAALVVRVTDQEGAALGGAQVAWYWPDAPADLQAGPQGGLPPQMVSGRAVSGFTNSSGDTGFGMGTGAYYFPGAGESGPHATWIYGQATRSDIVLGLGMIGATNHDHFDVEFVRLEEEDVPPADTYPREEVLAELARIEDAIRAIRDLMA